MDKKYSKYSDLELFNSLSGKQPEAELAFAELYSRYSQKIYAYCLRITGNKEDANDIFQETFLNFFNTAKSKPELSSVSGLMITIARNLCINHTRSKRIHIDLEEYNLQTNDTGYEQKELLDLISNALELLEFEFKDAFILRQYHGFSYKEIAEITGAPESTIRNRFWRAKEKIKEILAPYLHEISNNNN
ncbi:MAG: RNA polymerase sigma factor [Candidatus Kapaibacterium sp.]